MRGGGLKKTLNSIKDMRQGMVSGKKLVTGWRRQCRLLLPWIKARGGKKGEAWVLKGECKIQGCVHSKGVHAQRVCTLKRCARSNSVYA